MSYIFRAVMLGQESNVFPLLRDFLFRSGMRGTFCTTEIREIKAIIDKEALPAVFIDHTPGVNEGFLLYETLRKTPGLELVPFFFIVGETTRVLHKYAEALGAKGVITKPFKPTDITQMLKPLSSKQLLLAHQRALVISKSMLLKDYEGAIRGLAHLESTPYYNRGAGIGIARTMLALQKHNLTEKKLTEMLKRNPGDLRALCEVADLYTLSNRYPQAIRIFQRLEQLDPQMSVKMWEHFHLLVSVDDLNGASKLIEKMVRIPGYKEPTIEAMIRIMCLMGLDHLAPLLAKNFPQLAKKYRMPSEGQAS